MSDKEKTIMKLKNGLLKIPKILSWTMTILSLYFSWISIKSGTLTLEWYIIVTIIVGNSIFLIVCSLYEGFLYKKFTSQITLKENDIAREKERLEAKHKEEIEEKDKQNKTLTNEKTELRNGFEALKKLNENVIAFFREITDKYNFYSLRLQGINDLYVRKVKKLAQVNKKVSDADSEMEDIKKGYNDEYIKALVEVYNEFMGESTQRLKVVLDNYLRTKSIDLGVSIAIKQLNRIVEDINETKDVKVMTTFRDRETYVEGNREVGKREYTISGNTDFLHCLRNKAYINNDLLNDVSYNNENPNYKNQYTCTTVVPIVWEHNNVIKFYGYLTCDAFDSEQKFKNVMDNSVACMMNSVASLLARYFDDIQYSVQNMVYKNFFSEIYVIKLGGI